jgi:hypothetical protein
MSRNDGETVAFKPPSADIRQFAKGVFHMSYDVFKERVRGLVNRSGSKVSFHHEDGRHIARCSDGVTIIGNVLCPRVLVKWGSGHTAYATI